MVKVSVNLEDRDARINDQLAAKKTDGSKSDIIRTAIHEYCEKTAKKQEDLTYAIDAAFGIFKEAPLDADALRKDTNESGRL
jgi:metal-responsive CopG/Arc/MetJ family transcriptional regulator